MDTNPSWFEVFRSAAPAACDERALVLLAVGIRGAVEAGPSGFSLLVGAADADRALLELERYRLENRPQPRALPPRLHRGALGGAAAYVTVLFLVGVASSRSLGHFDWYGAGILDGSRFGHAELWRAVTALTLHADLAHLAANAGFGALFGYLAGRVYGAGAAWLLILVAATLANLVNGALMPDWRSSLGASTAVFAALGALAVHRWPAATRRARLGLAGAPIVAALVLLALLGTGDAHTDISAHALGFAAGALLSVPLRRFAPAPGGPQHRAAGIALLIVIAAWGAAFAAELIARPGYWM